MYRFLKKTVVGLKVVLIGVLFVVLLWAGEGQGGEIGKEGSTEPFAPIMGFSSNAYTEVDRNDAKVATKILGDILVRKQQKSNSNNLGDVLIYETLSELERDINAKKIDVAVMVSNEFLELRGRITLDPIVVSSREKTVYEELLLLVRKDSGVKELKDLRKRLLLLTRTQYGFIYHRWLETLLMKEGFHDIQNFFSEIKETRKPSQALMPVFFKQADACVVSRHYFEVNSELNPQIQKELIPISISQGYAGGVIAFRKDYNEEHKKSMKEILTTLHTDSHGKQMLLLFQMNKLVPFKPEYLNSMEALVKEHKDLKMKIAKAK